MKGIINFNKPKGMTSHDAVNYFRRKLDMKRIGHTGTLDPDVTGVLPICIGKATRVSEYVLLADKEYVGELTLGAKTDTQDSSGSIVDTSNKVVSNEMIEEVFTSYIGEINQTPPMYSAVRHKGKKLYELAREGIEVERKSRKANIYELEILSINENKIEFRVLCSKGTYIRTLCNDIGETLGTYGYMSYLRRTKVGNFLLEDAISKEDVDNMSKEELISKFLNMDIAITDMDDIIMDDSLYDRIINGVKVTVNGYDFDYDVDYKIYCKNIFIGVGEIKLENNINILKMKKVLV